MDAEKVNDKEASPAGNDERGVVVSRRRFARAGLSGSVVLGSLASKPVLGAVPYHCTVSGQVSGNLSRAALADECKLGESPAYWIATTAAWPGGITKGDLPTKQCAFNGQLIRGTNFNGYTPGIGVSGLTAAFFNVTTGTGSAQACSVTVTQTANPATMLQVLQTPTNDTDQFLLGRVVVASLLNAAQLGSFYPVTAHTIVNMFNATFVSGLFYPIDGSNTVTWNRTRVIEYLSSLIKWAS